MTTNSTHFKVKYLKKLKNFYLIALIQLLFWYLVLISVNINLSIILHLDNFNSIGTSKI